MTKRFEIFFSDLISTVQEQLCKVFKTTPKEENWNTQPFVTLEREMKKEEICKLHLITQRNQPYGSYRRCCERCGLSIFTFPTGDRYIDEESGFTKDLAETFNLKLCTEKKCNQTED